VYVIVILGLIAGFLGLRLYSVLGKRTGHEQQPAPVQQDDRSTKLVQPRPAEAQPAPVARPGESLISREAESGIRAIIAADRQFDVPQFVQGAQSAYGMILEAFWHGKRDDLRWLCDSDVAEAFERSIDEREALGHVLGNRLVRIDHAQIVEADLRGRLAHITVRFDADIAAVTRDADGTVVGGSMTDAVPTHDLWTFSRDISSNDPNWKLSATDEVE
jgi:predicted lipid-binding transport protein (Tim44 family)